MCKLHTLRTYARKTYTLHTLNKVRYARLMSDDADEPLDQRVQLVASRGFIRRVDDWRRLQTDLPSRSEAIRALTEKGLAAEAKRKK